MVNSGHYQIEAISAPGSWPVYAIHRRSVDRVEFNAIVLFMLANAKGCLMVMACDIPEWPSLGHSNHLPKGFHHFTRHCNPLGTYPVIIGNQDYRLPFQLLCMHAIHFSIRRKFIQFIVILEQSTLYHNECKVK